MEDNNQNENLVRELIFKVVFVGFPRVGKTSIINRAVNNVFQDISPPTTRVSISRYIYQSEGENVILEIFDYPGESQPTTFMPNYFRHVDAVVMVYDQTNLESYNLIKQTMGKLESLCDKPLKKIALYIVGNKSDLPICQLELYYEKAKQFSDECGAEFLQSSAKTASNIDVLFENIAQQVNNNYKNSKKSSDCILL